MESIKISRILLYYLNYGSFVQATSLILVIKAFAMEIWQLLRLAEILMAAEFDQRRLISWTIEGTVKAKK